MQAKITVEFNACKTPVPLLSKRRFSACMQCFRGLHDGDSALLEKARTYEAVGFNVKIHLSC